MPDLKQLHDAILTGDAKTAKAVTEQALADKVPPLQLVQEYMVPAMGEVGRRFERHEYLLLDDEEQRCLLLQGLKPGEKDCYLFTPLPLTEALPPQKAATFRAGDVVNLNGLIAPVVDLFQAEVRRAEGNEAAEFKPGEAWFGFTAQSSGTLLLARWNERRSQAGAGASLATPLLALLDRGHYQVQLTADGGLTLSASDRLPGQSVLRHHRLQWRRA